MRALRLDYVAARDASRLGAIVLVAGVLLATLALFEYRAVREELSAEASRAAEIRKSGKRSAAVSSGSAGDLETAAQELKAGTACAAAPVAALGQSVCRARIGAGRRRCTAGDRARSGKEHAAALGRSEIRR